jgi:hypothetical protein
MGMKKSSVDGSVVGIAEREKSDYQQASKKQFSGPHNSAVYPFDNAGQRRFISG